MVPKKLWENYPNTLDLHTAGLTHVWPKFCQIKLRFRQEREKICSCAFLKIYFHQVYTTYVHYGGHIEQFPPQFCFSPSSHRRSSSALRLVDLALSCNCRLIPPPPPQFNLPTPPPPCSAPCDLIKLHFMNKNTPPPIDHRRNRDDSSVCLGRNKTGPDSGSP